MAYAVTNPATGETVRTYDTITDAELEAAIAAADEAHRTWSKSSTVEQRAAMIRRVAELHTERRQELAELIVREMGKPIAQALSEVDFAADIYGYYADNAAEFLKDEPVSLLAGDGSAVIRRSSLGALLGVMPWNFPYYQVARFAAPNLVLGNVIVLKHASQCPESAAAIETIYRDAGLPDGAYVNVYVSAEQAATIVADARGEFRVPLWQRGTFNYEVRSSALPTDYLFWADLDGAPLKIDIPDGRIAGIVRDAKSGEPVPGATVGLQSNAGDREEHVKVTSGADGRFDFAGVKYGKHTVRVFPPAHLQPAPDQIQHVELLPRVAQEVGDVVEALRVLHAAHRSLIGEGPEVALVAEERGA